MWELHAGDALLQGGERGAGEDEDPERRQAGADHEGSVPGQDPRQRIRRQRSEQTTRVRVPHVMMVLPVGAERAGIATQQRDHAQQTQGQHREADEDPNAVLALHVPQ
jgi:hypothetical protein